MRTRLPGLWLEAVIIPDNSGVSRCSRNAFIDQQPGKPNGDVKDAHHTMVTPNSAFNLIMVSKKDLPGISVGTGGSSSESAGRLKCMNNCSNPLGVMIRNRVAVSVSSLKE